MDLNKAPKQFCENVNIGFTNEYFVLGVSSGEMGVVYSLTPGHAKRLAQALTHNVANYEKQFGELKTQWSENVPSPIQSGDLGK